MLAKAPLPSINLTPRRTQPHTCSRHGCFLLISSISGRSTRGGGVLVRAAGYTKVPMEAAGAYQVVDEETGEKFIVWGGDDDAPVPPKDVLSWKPDSNPAALTPPPQDVEGSEQVGAIVKNEAPAVKGLTGFVKLKVHKVRALAKKTFPRKQETDEHNKDPVVRDDRSTNANNKFKSMGNKKKKNSLRDGGNVSRDSRPQELKDRLQEFKDRVRGTRTEGGMNGSDLSVKRRVQPSSEYQKTTDGPRKSDARTSPRGSAANLAGWGDGEGGSVPESKYNTSNHRMRGPNLSIDSDFFSRKSFRDIGCKEYMIESLKAQSFSRPSHIQAMAFSSVFEGKSCIVADQSGSGKTLAYLAPLIQRLREEELQEISKSSPLSPRVVIIVPTAELASQVLRNCRSLSKFGVPFRSMVVTGGFRQKTQLETLQQGVDVVIATPGRFMYLIKEGFLQLTNIRCAVLDEVDILFKDEDFEASLQNLINSSPVTTQYLFATATLPANIYNKLVGVFPDCNVFMGPGMHRTSPRLEEVLVDCSGDYGSEKTAETAFTNKKTALLRIVGERPVSRTIVFCNKIETCRKVENALKRFDRQGIRVKVLPFHAALAQESRLANMKEFTNSESKEDSLFLVCTDRASRGIDFPGVDHVILFDFPRDPSEYVRRVGRTARGASGRGKAFALVVGKQVSLAGRIMERNQKGRPLHDVPSAYELFA